MHREARAFVEYALYEAVDDASRVVDLGGADRNGSLRSLFRDSDSYVAVDIEAGPGVDVVADAATYEPVEPPTLVLCCGVLEHVTDSVAASILSNAAKMLEPGGHLVVTCATHGWPPHRADGEGGPLLDGEFYRNVDVWQLLSWTRFAQHLTPVLVQVAGPDLFLVARKQEAGA